jgi:PiT family inorganic phosphate transporter
MASPLLAVVLAGTTYPFFRYLARRAGLSKDGCVCVQSQENLEAGSAGVLALASVPALEMTVSSAKACALHYREQVLGVSTRALQDFSHFLSAGAVSFARGLNDTPKIVGLMLVLGALGSRVSLLLVAAVMAVGGLLHARRVAVTVSRRITRMDAGQGLAANLVTSLLVLTASHSGLPVSTTHVSCGSLFGMGLTTRQANNGVIRQILFSWVLTVPIAAAIAAVAVSILR